jgi:hypothetical protein
MGRGVIQIRKARPGKVSGARENGSIGREKR